MLDKFLGDRGFWRTVLKLAAPIALQNLLTSSFVLVDTLMVGQLGDVPLSAVGMAGQFGWFMNMAIFGICSGASVFIAQYWGAGDTAGIRRAYGIAVASVSAACILCNGVAVLFPKAVIQVFNRESGVVEAGADYLRIAGWSYVAVGLSNIFSVTLRSVERVKLPMGVSGFTTVLNAVLDYGLIFGEFGMPELGVRGAALATVISAWAGPAVILLISALQKNLLIAPPKEVFGFGRKDLASFYRRATPVILNETLWGLGALIFNIIFANLGYRYFAAVTIFRTFENFFFVIFIGLCNAAGIMLGKGIGSGKVKRAVNDAMRFNAASVLLSAVLGVLVAVFRRDLAEVFNLSGNITRETLDITAVLILIHAIEMPVRNLHYIQIVGIFRAGGDTYTGMRLDLLSLWACSLPLTALAAFVLKLPFAVVFAIMYVTEDYLKTGLCLKHFFTYKWIRPITEQGRIGLEEFCRDRQAARKGKQRPACGK